MTAGRTAALLATDAATSAANSCRACRERSRRVPNGGEGQSPASRFPGPALLTRRALLASGVDNGTTIGVKEPGGAVLTPLTVPMSLASGGLTCWRVRLGRAYARRVSRHPADREQNWYPVSEAGRFTGHVRDGIEVTAHQLEFLQPARERPWLLDDATVARTIQVHRDQADDLALFQNQADRWKSASLIAAQQAEVEEYEAALAQLRDLNDQVLAVAAELAHGTVEATLAKSDLELGVEALLRDL